MRLADWLRSNRISRTDFARRIGLSNAAVTQLCNHQAAWMSRETAATIMRETGGAVTPNDFLDAAAQRTLPCPIPSTKPSRLSAAARS